MEHILGETLKAHWLPCANSLQHNLLMSGNLISRQACGIRQEALPEPGARSPGWFSPGALGFPHRPLKRVEKVPPSPPTHTPLKQDKNNSSHGFPASASRQLHSPVLTPALWRLCSRRTLIYLILTLNHIYPDYDFSQLRAHHFTKERTASEVEESIDGMLLEVSRVRPCSAVPARLDQGRATALTTQGWRDGAWGRMELHRALMGGRGGWIDDVCATVPPPCCCS